VNKIILIGHLGRDPELKRTATGKPIMAFTVATTSKWRDQQGEKQSRTEWHRCNAWGDRWEKVLPFMRKGQRVCVEGEVRYREGQSQEGHKTHYTDIHVEELELLSSRQENEAHQEKPLGSGKQQQASKQMELDDDLPF